MIRSKNIIINGVLYKSQNEAVAKLGIADYKIKAAIRELEESRRSEIEKKYMVKQSFTFKLPENYWIN